MRLLNKLYKWSSELFYLSNEEPPYVPLTRDEVRIVAGELFDAYPERRPGPVDKVFGSSTFITPFADEMRERQIKVDVVRLEESIEVNRDTIYLKGEDETKRFLLRRLEKRVLVDTSELFVTLEFDSLAKLKRALRITRWFPVRNRTIRIEGRVLYPYLKISLPQNRHHATFVVLPS